MNEQNLTSPPDVWKTEEINGINSDIEDHKCKGEGQEDCDTKPENMVEEARVPSNRYSLDAESAEMNNHSETSRLSEESEDEKKDKQSENEINSKIDALLLDMHSESGGESEIDENSHSESGGESEIDENSYTDRMAEECEEDTEIDDNSFIDGMAEEGEEDTPSDDSNDIIEVGEAINTTESELETDESYENDSFIDDDEKCELLSGNEFDLSLENSAVSNGRIDSDGSEKCKKRRRIVRMNCDSDDNVIILPKSKKKVLKKRKSRIIRFVDSSDDETQNDDKIEEPGSHELDGNVIQESSIHKIIQTQDEDENKKETTIKREESQNEEEVECDKVDEMIIEEPAIDKNMLSEEGKEKDLIKIESQSEQKLDEKEEETSTPVQNRLKEENNDEKKNKIIILENIRLQDNPELSAHINNVFSSICSDINITNCNVSNDNTEVNNREELIGDQTLKENTTIDSISQESFAKQKRKRRVKRKNKSVITTNEPSDIRQNNNTDGVIAGQATVVENVKNQESSLRQIAQKSKKKRFKKKSNFNLTTDKQSNTKAKVDLGFSRELSNTNVFGNNCKVQEKPMRLKKKKRNADHFPFMTQHAKRIKLDLKKSSEDARRQSTKIHVKDFRNMMLNDQNHVKRMNAKQLLRNKYL